MMDATIRDLGQANLPHNVPSLGGTRFADLRLGVWQPVLAGLVRIADLALLLMAGLPAYEICTTFGKQQPQSDTLLATFLAAVATSVAINRFGGYVVNQMRDLAGQISIVLLSLLLGASVMVLALLMQQSSLLGARAWVLGWVLGAGVFITCFRLILVPKLQAWSASGRLACRVAVVGTSAFSREIYEEMRAHHESIRLDGIYGEVDSGQPHLHTDVPLAGTLDDLIKRCQHNHIDDVLIAMPAVQREQMNQVCARLACLVSDVYLATDDLMALPVQSPAWTSFGGRRVITISRRPLRGWQMVQKAIFDRLLAAVLIILLSPVLAVVALAIRLDNPGPVLFRQPRLGFNNLPFTMLKFRSMHHAMSDPLAVTLTQRNDERITRVGKWLRKFSLDELPQLFNVLSGDMSLVGPRPHALKASVGEHLYADLVAAYAQRHRVKPGITGWAQINGWRGETKIPLQIENRVKFDLEYIERWSLALDVKILVLTVIREVFSKHAF